jgi:light-independent protochlorophyllide reductase subunit B
VISAPVHVQDFPARYSPQMGFEGANVLFDTWVHPLMMGLEEHLLTMFRGDFEFHDGALPSHLGASKLTPARADAAPAETAAAHSAAAQPPASGAPAQDGPGSGAAHLATAATAAQSTAAAGSPTGLPAGASVHPALTPAVTIWAAEAERELHKIPFFVRGKARRNTEKFALEKGLATITIETLYDAKAHFGR